MGFAALAAFSRNQIFFPKTGLPVSQNEMLGPAEKRVLGKSKCLNKTYAYGMIAICFGGQFGFVALE
jgi:hypothetical protein